MAETGTVEINEDHLNENKQTVHSELGIVREPATIICVWQTFKGRQRDGKTL